MVTQEPLPDRCGARVTHKLGATITLGDDPELTLTDEVVGICRFVDDADDPSAIVETRANYKTLRKWLWDDYVLDAVGLDPGAELGATIQASGPTPTATQLQACSAVTEVDSGRPTVGQDLPGHVTYQAVELEQATYEHTDDDEDDPTADALLWIDIDGSATHNVTNRYNELQGYCERYPMTDYKSCNDHRGSSPDAMKGNNHGGTRNGMGHGMFATRSNYFEAMTDEEQAFVHTMVESWLEDAPFGWDHKAKMNELYRAAIDQHRAMGGLDAYVDEQGNIEGMTKEVTVDYDPERGEEITAEDEHPVNLPYSRLDRDILSKLDKLDVINSSEIDDETTESIAKLLSGAN